MIKAYGDEASLDQILVGLYRKFKVSQKRRFVQNKLYRMKDTVWSVSGRKGVYTTTNPKDAPDMPPGDTDDNGYEEWKDSSERDFDSEIPF